MRTFTQEQNGRHRRGDGGEAVNPVRGAGAAARRLRLPVAEVRGSCRPEGEVIAVLG
ncbi:hypothetical protein OG905_03520 [Streptomyces sp. NBC_00322]|uniref:hypothetical protein n=1 Tax=Streptomyces sp. NBC_00322 TaxID=2975712 RepID=UPI002E2DE9CA|nr:hypothetical protein [Streptomyces sp. NBC_00322]